MHTLLSTNSLCKNVVLALTKELKIGLEWQGCFVSAPLHRCTTTCIRKVPKTLEAFLILEEEKDLDFEFGRHCAIRAHDSKHCRLSAFPELL